MSEKKYRFIQQQLLVPHEKRLALQAMLLQLRIWQITNLVQLLMGSGQFEQLLLKNRMTGLERLNVNGSERSFQKLYAVS